MTEPAFDLADFDRRMNEAMEAARAGSFDRAVAAMTHAYEQAQRLPDVDERRLMVTANLAATYVRASRLEEARPFYEEALRLATPVLAKDDPMLGDLHVNLGGIALANGDLERAQHHHDRALAIWSAALPAEHPKLAALKAKIARANAPLTTARVAVQPPPGAGWEVEATEQGGVAMIKARRADRGDFFFMIAKDYEVAPDQVLAPSALVERVFRGNYERTFTDVRYESSTPIDVNGHPGQDASIVMRHAKLGPIRKFERVVCVGTHVLVCSVEGNPETYARMTSAIERWFAGTRFAALG